MDKLSIEKIQRMIEHKQEQIDAVVLGGHIFSAMEKGGLKAEKQAFEELLQLRAQPDNPALTLEDLNGMDGEPVWVQLGDGIDGYGICEKVINNEFIFHMQCGMVEVDSDFINMEYNDPIGRFGLHVLGWRAYRYRPKEDNHG